ncbi:MAG: sigma-70 family RNA polymerase sigma factor [Clostridiales bacterium]|nr:sigma-70 family RNA polymerase sigma factor [Clostridiales bacterium]
MNDDNITKMFFERNESAISSAYEKYGRCLLRISKNILESTEDAEECVSDALLAAWNSVPPNNPENIKTYLCKLTREISVSAWRKKRAQKRGAGEYAASLEEIEEIVSGAACDDAVTENAVADAISAFLRLEPETERNIFVRRYFYGDKISEICKAYGFGQSKVKMTLKRMREKLAKYLEKEGFDL